MVGLLSMRVHESDRREKRTFPFSSLILRSESGVSSSRNSCSSFFVESGIGGVSPFNVISIQSLFLVSSRRVSQRSVPWLYSVVQLQISCC